MPLSVIEVFEGIQLGLYHSQRHVLHSYVYVPLGVMAILITLYGLNELLLSVFHFVFPALVLLLLLNFAALCLLSAVLGKRYTALYLRLLDIPTGWALRWINIFFTPSFIILPLSERISAKEALTIAAVFVFGYLTMSAICAYVLMGIQALTGKKRRLDLALVALLPDTITLTDLETEEITMQVGGISQRHSTDTQSSLAVASPLREPMPNPSLPVPMALSTHKVYPESTARVPSPVPVCVRETYLDVQQGPFSHPLDGPRTVAAAVVQWFDWMVFAVLLVVGLPLYYALDYAMPLQLAIGVLLYLAALLPSARFRRFVHPILLSVAGCLLLFYVLSLATPAPRHHSFLTTIQRYKTGRTYLNLFKPAVAGGRPPGAGDVLSSLMDVAIVSLSVPMFTYRGDLRRHAAILVPPLLLCIICSFFGYPIICYKLGISPERALAFSGRSVTLALGTPLVNALGGSVPLMAVTTILSGILGVLTGPLLLRLLRVRDDDYVTRGVTLGANCGAVATAWLMTTDPRAAAMSSLSFVLFGVGMVILGAIPSLTTMVRSWVGL